MGGLQIQAVNTPFRAVTPGQVRKIFKKPLCSLFLYSMQCSMMLKNVWELHSLLALVHHCWTFSVSHP